MTTLPLLRRLAAFTTDPSGGNPAGVWIGEAFPPAGEMQALAAEIGFSETAFLVPRQGEALDVRYFSPEAEVRFCGHATIASGVLLGELRGPGTYRFATPSGEVEVEVERAAGSFTAALRSVAPAHRPVEPTLLARALDALGWTERDLDSSIPPAVAYAGAWHLVLALRERSTLDALDYDFDALKAAMLDADLTTVQLVWREAPDRFHARDPFPVGGVVEDPATGAAAAALGGYLRDAGLLAAPAAFVILQGEAMGRPSRLEVEVPASGGIVVRGAAVALDTSAETAGL